MKRISLCLALLAIGTSSAAQEAHSLHDLLSGVAVSKKTRLAIYDVTVHRKTVRALFDVYDHADSRFSRYIGANSEAIVKLKNRAAMAELRAILIHENAVGIAIGLRDTGLVAKGYSKLPKALLPNLVTEAVISIPLLIEVTPCEQITRIVYQEIDAVFQRQLRRAAETGEAVTLDDVFRRLLDGKLKAYLDELPSPTQDDSCVTTFDLLKWMKSEDVRGFAFSSYAVTPMMRNVLQVIAGAIGKFRHAQRYRLQIDVTGFTDNVAFKQVPNLRLSTESITDQPKRPLHVFYGRCVADHAKPVAEFVPFGGTGTRAVGESVRDNCELGAVRAYAATAVLASMLGPDLTCRYATGGVARSGADASDDEKRKIAVQILVETATVR